MRTILIFALIFLVCSPVFAQKKKTEVERIYEGASDATLDSAQAWADSVDKHRREVGEILNQITLKEHKGHKYYRLPDQSIDRCYHGSNCAIFHFCETCSAMFHLFEHKPLARETVKRGDKIWKVEKYQLEQE